MEALQNPVRELVKLGLLHLRGVKRFRRLALGIAWVVALVGWGTVYAIPDVYEANARIYVDTDSMLQQAVGGLAMARNMAAEIAVLTRAMLSRPQLEKVVRESDLGLRAHTEQDTDNLISGLEHNIKISGGHGDNLYVISYRAGDRAMTEKIVGMLLTTFVEDALGNNRNDSGAAIEFIDDQLRDYEQRLDEAERRLADFKRENVGLMPGDKGDYYTRLQAGMTELGATRAKLDLALQSRAELERQLVGEEPVFGIMTDDSPNSIIDARIAQNEAEIADLLVRFTDDYPGVVSRRATIERLKQEREAQKARAPLKVTVPNPLDVNPVYQQIKVQLSAADVEVVTLKGQVAAQQHDVDHLKGLVDTIPDIERRLTALNRDYQVTQQQYAQLLQRRDTVRLTAQVGQAGNHVKFRIIDPPLASLNPVSPNRTILLAGVLAAAFGIALVVAFVLNQLSPVVITSADLRHLAGLPVLGTITRVLTDGQRKARRNRALLFAVGCATLILVLGIAVLFQGPAADFVAKVVAGRFA